VPSDVALQVNFIVRLILAALLGAAIGAQREVHGAPAGMRTHLLVSFGSAMFTIVSANAFLGLVAPVDQHQATAYDPTRIAAQIVTGIGFLGAGAIIKDGATIRGLTTAASLWTAAAIGMAVGAGQVLFALAGAIIILISLGPLGSISARLAPRAAREVTVRLRVRSLEVVDAMASQLSHHGVEIAGVASTPLEDGRFEVEIQFQVPGKTTVAKLMSVIFSAQGVEAAETLTPAD
jgi:putative Mg2+ transporter-C (MgtC) family protein